MAKPVPEFKSLIYNGEQRQLDICAAESIQSLYGFDTLLPVMEKTKNLQTLITIGPKIKGAYSDT